MRRVVWIVAIAVGLASTTAVADEAATYYRQALAYKKQGKIEKAVELLEKAIRERDDYAAAHFSLGILYRQQQRYGKAIYQLERAAELSPRSADVHYSLGLAYYRRGRKGDAIRALEKAAELAPKDARVAAQLGVMLLRSDPVRAVAQLERAVAADPRDAENVRQLGIAYRRAAVDAAAHGKASQHDAYLKRAERTLLRALGMHETAAVRFDLGVLYRRMEQSEKAIENYRRAVDLDPEMAAAWWDLGHVYARADQPGEAVGAFQRYLDLEPNSPDAKIARDRINELGGTREPARHRPKKHKQRHR